MSITFADLFAGIGGFHAAMSSLGLDLAYASEIDRSASRVYERTWQAQPLGDLREVAGSVGKCDVLCAGFPCQPFSKSGMQLGTSEARGTLFWPLHEAIARARPSLIVLENVRNLAGPRHRHTWDAIVDSLRGLGYAVPSEPTVFSPHWLPPELGGAPQARERVFIVGLRVGRARAANLSPVPPVAKGALAGWDVMEWDLDLHLRRADSDDPLLAPSDDELRWISAWNDFLQRLPEDVELPGFPIWADDLVAVPDMVQGLPKWKASFLSKNAAFYTEHSRQLDEWKGAHSNLAGFPRSRRKLEWQAQDSPRDLWSCVMHFRPSGIRVKKPTYLPALVAMAQIPLVGPWGRRISTREAADLQGLSHVDFSDQSPSETYRQLGNAVSVGAVRHVVLTALDLWREWVPDHLADLGAQATEHASAVRAWQESRTADERLVVS